MRSKGIDWDVTLKRYADYGNAEIGRIVGVTPSAVYCARSRRGLPCPVRPVRRVATGDDRVRIMEALRNTTADPLDGEVWLVSPWNSGRAVSNLGRVLELGNRGAPPPRPAVRTISPPTTGEVAVLHRTMVGGRRRQVDSLPRVVLTAFNRPASRKGEMARLRSDSVSAAGVSYFLDNLVWSDDRLTEDALEILRLITVERVSMQVAAMRMGLAYSVVRSRVKRARRLVESSGGPLTIAEANRAREAMEVRVREAAERRADRLRWAISWDAVSRKK